MDSFIDFHGVNMDTEIDGTAHPDHLDHLDHLDELEEEEK